MQVKFFDLHRQNEEIKKDILKEIRDVMDSNQYILGPKVVSLESKIAHYCGTNYALALSSGTDALLVALMAIGIEPGDEVITTPFTFFATAGSIVRAGGKPVFADIDPVTFNISPSEIERKITVRTKCIMPVHLYGQCADMNSINKIARERGIPVIEDAAQAIGAKIKAFHAGNMSDIGCFSFFPTKNLGGCGEGGMAVCNKEAVYKKMVMMRNHGSEKRYHHEYIGGNFRMHAFQAAALRVKLKKLDGYIKKRRENASLYEKYLDGISPVTLPKETAGHYHTYNQYVIRAERRDELKEFLSEQGVSTEIYYPLCLHEQNCFKYLGCKLGDFPAAEKASLECLALPIYPELEKDEIKHVSARIKNFYDR